MDKSEIREATAEQLRYEIAKALGWKRDAEAEAVINSFGADVSVWRKSGQNSDGTDYERVVVERADSVYYSGPFPDWATQAAWAMTLVADFSHFQLDLDRERTDTDKRWYCTLAELGKFGTGHVWGETAAIAICRAWLLAHLED